MARLWEKREVDVFLDVVLDVVLEGLQLKAANALSSNSRELIRFR